MGMVGTYNGYYSDMQVFKRLNNPSHEGNDIYDPEWVVEAFLRNTGDLDEVDAINRFWTPVENKFTDTSLGGNIPLNVYPQFTRYADIRVKGRMMTRHDVTINNLTGNLGMGRFYGEKLDDNSIDVYFTFGVPEFNNMFNFLLSAVDYKKTVIVSKGRNPTAYEIGYTWGKIAMFVAFPIVTTFVTVASFLKDVLIGPGKFSYYYLKENMVAYWSTVNSLVTLFATELGILAPFLMKTKKDPHVVGTPLKIDQDDLDFIKRYMPTLITGENYIDVFAMVTKAQRLAYRQVETEMELYEKGILNDKDFIGIVKNNLYPIHNVPNSTFSNFIDKIKNLTGLYGPDNTNTTNTQTNNKTPTIDKITQNSDGTIPLPDREIDKPSFISQFFDNIKASYNEGARFVAFRVEHPSSPTETFTNEVGEIPLEGAIKSISGKVKEITFSTSGGNIIPGTDEIISAAKDVIHGALDGLTFGLSNILSVLEGGANIELPLRWVDSNATFPTISFRMKLIAPYGNPISQLQNIYIPLAAILAAALPRSTGPSSYGSPFLCSMFIRGLRNIELGMITHLSITRGTSNLPYNKQRRPLAIDVTFSVKDFSKIIAVSTVNNIFDPANVAVNDDSPLMRYLSALTGRSFYNTMYLTNKQRIRISKIFEGVQKFLSPAYWGVRTGDSLLNFPLTEIFSKKVELSYKESF